MTILEWNCEEKQDILELLQFFTQLFWNLDDPVRQTIQNGRVMMLVTRILPLISPSSAQEMETVCQMIQENAHSKDVIDMLRDGYVQLFVNDAGKISAPLYESCYESESGTLMGPAAVKMDHRLQAHGLSIQTSGNEPPDHLAVELEFLYFLLFQGCQNNPSESLNEARQFAGETLSPFLRNILDRLKTDLRFPIYTRLVQALGIIVLTIAE
ncbi:MAG TPA: molecular chaperone TorD family protein [Desulfatirhabdiaceae bacterium]|nr:molecular chaperone TorD family protein [Desulfatirhabdiaceae bacterium]